MPLRLIEMDSQNSRIRLAKIRATKLILSCKVVTNALTMIKNHNVQFVSVDLIK